MNLQDHITAVAFAFDYKVNEIKDGFEVFDEQTKESFTLDKEGMINFIETQYVNASYPERLSRKIKSIRRIKAEFLKAKGEK